MRFVELRHTPEGEAMQLHPRITWLRGLDPAARVAVVGLAHEVALGDMPEWDGIVEIDGTEYSLAEGVEEMGATAESALIIDAASLPAAESDDSSTPSLEDYEASLTKLEDLNDRIEGLAEELAASGTVRADMKAELAEALERVDVEAGAALDHADGALGCAARAAARPDPWTGMSDVPTRIAELETQTVELEETLAALPTGDRPPLAAAAATARAAISSGAVPSPEAAALAQAWTSLHQRLRGLESRIEAAGGGTEAVAARLEDARAAARVAEDGAVPRPITKEEANELEVLHDAMIEAEQKTGRGVRRSANRAAFDRAEAALQAALGPLGYPTWAGFRMGNGLASVTDEALAAYEQSQEDLKVAEIEWAELMTRLERDTDLQDVLGAIDRALEHARELLDADPYAGGDANDPEVVTAALQALRVDADSVGVARDAAMTHLRQALEAAGAAGHGQLTSDAAVVALGDSWLSVLCAADDVAVRVLRDRERTAEELEALRELGEGSRVDQLDVERATVRTAEAAVAATRTALIDVMRARTQLHVLAATELSLAEEHDDRLVQRESAQVLVDLAERRLTGGAGADATEALVGRVPRGSAGSIPVVVVMGAAPASMLNRLQVLPDDVQILVIGEGAGMDDWLCEVGDDIAAVIDVRTLV